jgi:hypothetical protein
MEEQIGQLKEELDEILRQTRRAFGDREGVSASR